MDNVIQSFGRLNDFFRDFAWSSHQQNDALYSDKLNHWRIVTQVSSEAPQHFEELIILYKERIQQSAW